MPRLARSRGSRRSAAAIAWIAAAALAACGSDDPDGRTIRFEIPAGAGELVDAGRDVPGVPTRIEGRVGDTVEVVNHDSEMQVVSGFPVSPGQTLSIPLNRSGSCEVDCSAHDDNSLRMVVAP